MALEPTSYMMSPTIRVLSTAAVLLVIGSLPLGAPWAPRSVRGQSLADVAREEEARRKEIKEPARVLTNKDLGSVPPPTAQAAPAAVDSADKGGSSGKAAAKDDKGGAAKDQSAKNQNAKEPNKDQAKDQPRDQKYWSGRMKELLAAIDQDDTFAAALQSRINALTADFSGRDDPAQRNVIARDRQKAIDELDRVTKRIASTKKAVADLQEEARRASVPPGWLR